VNGDPQTAADLYVAPNGDDTWSGTLPAPNAAGTDGPLATLGRARDALRALRGADGQRPGPRTVLVRGGRYYLAEALVLGPADSGTQQCPVTWQAWPGETPVLSGGRPVTGWQPYRGPILQAQLPQAKGGKWRSRQLFYRGQRQVRARWPKLDPANPLYGGWAFPESVDADRPFEAFRVHEGFLARPWAKPTEAEVNIFTGYGWLNEIIPVAAADPTTRTIVLQRRIKDFDCLPWYWPVPLNAGSRFCVENVLEELTQPGEWCLDGEEGRLYFWPVGNISAAEVEVVVPRLRCLIDLHGAAWVNLAGLCFTETLDGDNYHREGLDVGAMFNIAGLPYCGEAVHLRQAEHCRIEGCHFDQVGGNAVYLEAHNLRHVIARNRIRGCGANGVVLAGDRFHHPFGNRVEDNDIADTGVFNKYTAGVFLGIGDGNLVRHNRIERVPHHAINLADNPHGRNVIEYNWIRFADQEISDSGAINSWMEKPVDPNAQRCGHIIRFNYIADTLGCEARAGQVGRMGAHGAPATGIYLDNQTSHCLVYGNIVVRAGNAGIVVHMGKNNLIENNIIVDCPIGVLFQEPVARGLEYYRRFLGYMTGNLVLRNIVCPAAGTRRYLALDGWTERLLADCDGNLIAPVAAEDGAGPIVDLEPFQADKHQELALDQWRGMGYDVRTVVAEPLFVDPAHDDFRLQPASPALALGFAPLPFARIGPREGGA
jgi:parallel beta-helix repeat protein